MLTDLNSLLALQELDLKLRDLELRLKMLPKEIGCSMPPSVAVRCCSF